MNPSKYYSFYLLAKWLSKNCHRLNFDYPKTTFLHRLAEVKPDSPLPRLLNSNDTTNVSFHLNLYGAIQNDFFLLQLQIKTPSVQQCHQNQNMAECNSIVSSQDFKITAFYVIIILLYCMSSTWWSILQISRTMHVQIAQSTSCIVWCWVTFWCAIHLLPLPHTCSPSACSKEKRKPNGRWHQHCKCNNTLKVQLFM